MGVWCVVVAPHQLKVVGERGHCTIIVVAETTTTTAERERESAHQQQKKRKLFEDK